MEEEHDIYTTFGHFQVAMEKEQDLREVIRNTVKEVDQISREVTTVLQVIHHNEAAISTACQKARDLFAKARMGYLTLQEMVPHRDYYKYQDHWRFMTQRYCFLIALTVWLEKGFLVSHKTTAEIIGLAPKENDLTFHLEIEDYLVGVLMLCTELSRLAVNSVTRGDYERPMQISKFVMELNGGFRLLNLKNDHLRKRFDALKYDVKKIEEVVYDLSIRGLLAKVEGEDSKEESPSTPESAPTPEPTPKSAPTPEPMETPEPAPTPKSAATPEPMLTPEATPTPKSAPTPEPMETPEPAPTPESAPTPEPTS